MRFVDQHVFRDDRFSVGVEQHSGRCYLSITVSSRMVDYEEHYEIDRALLDAAPGNRAALRELANRCRRRENDARLMLPPGAERGEADPIDYPPLPSVR